MTITVLGSGCSNCKKLEENTRKAVNDLHINLQVNKESDYSIIASYGVMNTPALVINNKVVLQGRVPDVLEIKELISNAI